MKKQKFINLVLIVPVIAGLILAHSVFAGASGTAGQGYGAISTDGSKNVTIGSSNADTAARLFVIASTSDSSYFGFKVVQPNLTPVFTVRNDGLIIVGTNQGIKFSDGTVQTTAYLGGSQTVVAGNVGAGYFGSNTGGGNYSFPANVGIGTASPAQKLDVSGNIIASGGVYWGGGSGQRTETKDDAGAIASRSGFFQTAAPVNYYAGASNWQHLIEARHTNDANNYALQIAGSFFDQDLYFRKTNNNPSTVWNKFVYQNSAGNVGIGTASPGYKLDVAGDIRAQNAWLRTTGNTGWYSDTYGGGWYMQDGTWIRGYNGKSLWMGGGLVGGDGGLTIGYGGAGSPAGGAIIAGNVGIGTTAPGSPLTVAGTIYSSAGGFKFPDGTTQTTASGAASQWTTTSTGVYYNGGNVGIGTAAPSYALVVKGAGSNTDYFQNGVSNVGQTLYLEDTNNGAGNGGQVLFGTSAWGPFAGIKGFIQNGTGPAGGISFMTRTMSGNIVDRLWINYDGTVVVGGQSGGGKLTVGTIDPVYSIEGTKYATYVSGMTGQKEETSGNISLACSGGKCEKTIDFNLEPAGSDLWLFSRATDLKNNFKEMAVLLTPAFNGRVWYRKSSNTNLKIFATTDNAATQVELSYRLTAPRFDSANWTNYNHDFGVTGLKPPAWDN